MDIIEPFCFGEKGKKSRRFFEITLSIRERKRTMVVVVFEGNYTFIST